jgi:hypothetical protein
MYASKYKINLAKKYSLHGRFVFVVLGLLCLLFCFLNKADRPHALLLPAFFSLAMEAGMIHAGVEGVV